MRCWPGRVHRYIASFTPVKAEWPCQPRATSKMSRLEATLCSFQVGVSMRMMVLIVSLLHIIQTEFLFFSNKQKTYFNKLVLLSLWGVFCQQESEGNVCWTHLPKYYSVTCAWTQGRARPVRVYVSEIQMYCNFCVIIVLPLVHRLVQ